MKLHCVSTCETSRVGNNLHRECSGLQWLGKPGQGHHTGQSYYHRGYRHPCCLSKIAIPQGDGRCLSCHPTRNVPFGRCGLVRGETSNDKISSGLTRWGLELGKDLGTRQSTCRSRIRRCSHPLVRSISIGIGRGGGARSGAPNWVPVALVAGMATAVPVTAAARRKEVFMVTECE